MFSFAPVKRVVFALTLSLGSVLLAVTGLGRPVPASAVTDVPPATVPERYLNQTITWAPCDFDELLRFFYEKAPHTNCATVTVPMDWRHPDDHPDISLAIAYSRATGTSQGLLVANPGGPGVEGLDFTSFLAVDKTRMFRDFDLLGFDPRGFGNSTNVHCTTTVDRFEKLPSVNDPRVRGPKAHAAEMASAKLYADVCGADEIAPFVGTQQTADDLEFLRRLLGQNRPDYDKLNYIGYSYGTWLGAWYADTYPDHVGRFVLDSNMNWTTSMYANQVSDPKSFQRRRDKMLYPWIARHHKRYGLGKTATAVKKNYEKIRAAVAKAYKRGDAIYSPAEGDDIIATQIYDDLGFYDAASTILQLKAVGRGKAGSGVRRALADSARAAGITPAHSLAAADDDETIDLEAGSEVVRCNDSTWSRDLTSLLKRADSDAIKYPFVGYANTVSMCSYWKYAPVQRTVQLAGVPIMLMLQSEGDPATSYEGALAAHKATAEHTRLVSVADEGQHGLYVGGPSKCAEKLADSFLFAGQLPAADTVCSTKPLPGDKKVYPLSGPVSAGLRAATADGPATAPVNRRLAEIRAAAARVR